MAELDAPLEIEFDYVVEVINAETGAITEAWHYENYDRAYGKYNKLEERDSLVLLALYTTVRRILNETSTHKLILAKNK